MRSVVHCDLPVSTQRGDTVVILPPEIDARNAPLIGDQLFILLDQGVPSLIMDLTTTRFCDCAGLRAIVRAGRRAHALRTPACVALPAAGPVHRVAQLTGLAGRAPVSTGLAAAHRHLHRTAREPDGASV
jgi:anti-sigma B factor antagonist